MFALIKPLVLTGLKSDKFKKFVVELLEKLVESTDNELDDRALQICLLYTSPSPRDLSTSRMPSSA